MATMSLPSLKRRAAVAPSWSSVPNSARSPSRCLDKPSPATVFDYSCALAQGDWCPRPALTCGEVCCFRDLKVLDAGQVLYNVFAIGIPHVDAVSETGAIVFRHFSLSIFLSSFNAAWNTDGGGRVLWSAAIALDEGRLQCNPSFWPLPAQVF
jgi:hypothetical protein